MLQENPDTELICERCESEMFIENLSWFTDGPICAACMAWESILIDRLNQDDETDEGEYPTKHENLNSEIIPTEEIDAEVKWGSYPPEELR